jgi:hypothetical protein
MEARAGGDSKLSDNLKPKQKYEETNSPECNCCISTLFM